MFSSLNSGSLIYKLVGESSKNFALNICLGFGTKQNEYLLTGFVLGSIVMLFMNLWDETEF